MIRLLAALSFGAGQPGVSTLREGWSLPEDAFVWSLGNESTLELPAPVSPEGISLELKMGVLTHPPKLTSQLVEIIVNGTITGRRRFGGEGTWRLDLPPSCVRAGAALRITLRHPDAASPESFGRGGDSRRLAIRLRKATLLQDTGRSELPQRAGRLVLEQAFRFGWNETTAPMLLSGWRAPEAEYAWAVGHQSRLRLPVRDRAARYTLILDMRPFTSAPTLPRQRIAITAGSSAVQYVAITHRTVVAVDLPPVTDAEEFIDICFDNFDAAAPRPFGLDDDGRVFAFMLLGAFLLRHTNELAAAHIVRHAAGGLEPGDLVMQFESLGNLCEFGILQRRLGQEPSGLFRFAGIMTPLLVDGLMHGFAGLGRPDTLAFDPSAEPDEYLVVDDAYSLSFRTPAQSGQGEEKLRLHMGQRLPFLVRKFLEDAAASEKIFIFHRPYATSRQEAEAVLAALALWGDPAMLWIVADQAERPGSVVRLGPRLLCGFFDPPQDGAPMAADETWLSVLRNALALRQEESASF